MKRFLSSIAAAGCLLLASSCGATADQSLTTAEIIAMDTVISLSFYGDSGDVALEQAEQEIERLEGLLSATDPESEVAILNDSGETQPVSDEVWDLLHDAIEYSAATDGAF